MTQPSRLYRLIEMKLDEPLADFVAARRFPTKSWQEIAEEIEQRTGETLTGEVVRRWFADRSDAPGASDRGAA